MWYLKSGKTVGPSVAAHADFSGSDSSRVVRASAADFDVANGGHWLCGRTCVLYCCNLQVTCVFCCLLCNVLKIKECNYKSLCRCPLLPALSPKNKSFRSHPYCVRLRVLIRPLPPACLSCFISAGTRDKANKLGAKKVHVQRTKHKRSENI